MNTERMFHELSNVMGAVHNLAYLRTTHAAGQTTDAAMESFIDQARDDIMSLLQSTSEFRRAFNAQSRIERATHVRYVRNQRERAAAVPVAPVAVAPVAVAVAVAPIIYAAETLFENAPPPGGRRRQRPLAAAAAAPAPLKKPKTKAIKASQLEEVMPDVCGICLEEYTRANSVSTCCGHSFCSSCYTSAAEHCAANSQRKDRKMKCPMCRKESPKLTVFRARKAPVRRPVQPPVEPEPEPVVAVAETNILIVVDA